jgi:cyclopropane-fatty-acyl-phospholipid synthase
VGRSWASAERRDTSHHPGRIYELREVKVRLICWDGSQAGDPQAAASVLFRRKRALRRILWAPNELGLVRAYVSGDVDFDGDIFAVLDLRDVIERVAHHQGIGLSTH